MAMARTKSALVNSPDKCKLFRSIRWPSSTYALYSNVENAILGAMFSKWVSIFVLYRSFEVIITNWLTEAERMLSLYNRCR